MQEIAPNVYMLNVMPRDSVNVYFIGDVLIDAGIRYSRRKILRHLKGRSVKAHALTHAHADHQGSSKAICEHLKIPLWCGGGDAHAMESGDLSSIVPDNVTTRLLDFVWAGPAYPVSKRLEEGDKVADFVVMETPGHSPGHISFWREKDRVLIAGDVLRNIDYLTSRPKLGEPPSIFTVNITKNRESIRKIAELSPRLIAFGHGPVLEVEGQLEELLEKIKEY